MLPSCLKGNIFFLLNYKLSVLRVISKSAKVQKCKSAKVQKCKSAKICKFFTLK